MNLEDFIELVPTMRGYQRNYSVNRDRYNQQKAKQYEKEVDHFIKNFKEKGGQSHER